MAPKLEPFDPASELESAPCVVVGFLSSPSGLGQSARLTALALASQGRDVYGIDLSPHFFEQAGGVEPGLRDGRSIIGPARVIVNVNAPYLKYVFQLLGRRFLSGKLVIGYWAWELPNAPDSWREGFLRVHQVAAPSEFVAGALRDLDSQRAVEVAPHPVALEDLPELTPRTQPVSADAPFTVVNSMNAASGFERKNPVALIAAFRHAFPRRQDVRLRMLISNIEHYQPGRAALLSARGDDARIEITFADFDRVGYWSWYGSPDLYASLHRAEGFGLPLAESMCVGVPVLATHWSANAEYMDEANALPVRYTLVPVQDPQMKYQDSRSCWAEADRSHAATLLRRAIAEPDWLAGTAAKGHETARTRFSRFTI